MVQREIEIQTIRQVINEVVMMLLNWMWVEKEFDDNGTVFRMPYSVQGLIINSDKRIIDYFESMIMVFIVRSYNKNTIVKIKNV